MSFDWFSGDKGVEIAMEMARVSRTHFRHCSQLLEKLGISAGQAPVLALLMQTESMSQRELAREIHITPASVSGLLKRMEREGMVTRTSDPRDARSTLVALSDKGRQICARAMQYFCGSASVLIRDFTEQETETLYGFVQRMLANLDRAAQEMEGGEKKDPAQD